MMINKKELSWAKLSNTEHAFYRDLIDSWFMVDCMYPTREMVTIFERYYTLTWNDDVNLEDSLNETPMFDQKINFLLKSVECD